MEAHTQTSIRPEDLNLRGQSYRAQWKAGFRPRKDLPPWPLTLPLDWDADPFEDLNWCSQLHQWRMVDPILQEYFNAGDAQLLREALRYALDWHRFHIIDRRETVRSWRSATVGLRALRIAFLLSKIEAGELQASQAELDALFELADEHARRLQDERFIALGNHGLFQVFGLALLARAAPDRPASNGGVAFAERKLKEILRSQFDDHGVHREHSPAYHFFVTKKIEELGATRHFDVPEVTGILAAAEAVKPWLVFPDGREARIGDSPGHRRRVPPPRRPRARLSDRRRYLVGDLTQSGYAVVRSPGSRGASMLFITAMCHGTGHKHADDLSFELFEHGRRILVDSGKYKSFADPMRDYMVSAAAHNTISLDGVVIDRRHVEPGGSALTPIECDGACFKLSGTTRRRDLFTQHRTFLYDPGRFLVIADHVVADERQTFVSSLHLPPELVPEVHDSGFGCTLDDGRLLAGEVVTRATVDSVRGQRDPLAGWFSPRPGEVVPTTTIRALRRGRTRDLTWAIWFDQSARVEALRQAKAVEPAGLVPESREQSGGDERV
jgi:hypothetical protein